MCRYWPEPWRWLRLSDRTVCVQRAGKQSERSYNEFAQFHLKPDCYLKDLVKDDVPDELEWEWSDDSFWDALGCFTAAGWSLQLKCLCQGKVIPFVSFICLYFSCTVINWKHIWSKCAVVDAFPCRSVCTDAAPCYAMPWLCCQESVCCTSQVLCPAVISL